MNYFPCVERAPEESAVEFGDRCLRYILRFNHVISLDDEQLAAAERSGQLFCSSTDNLKAIDLISHARHRIAGEQLRRKVAREQLQSMLVDLYAQESEPEPEPTDGPMSAPDDPAAATLRRLRVAMADLMSDWTQGPNPNPPGGLGARLVPPRRPLSPAGAAVTIAPPAGAQLPPVNPDVF